VAAEPEHSDQPDTVGEPPVQADASACDDINDINVAVHVCDRGGETPISHFSYNLPLFNYFRETSAGTFPLFIIDG